MGHHKEKWTYQMHLWELKNILIPAKTVRYSYNRLINRWIFKCKRCRKYIYGKDLEEKPN